MQPAPRPVIFIHGLWLHRTSWAPWVEAFAQAGYSPTAPGWPHEAETVAEARQQPEAVAGLGIDDVTNHYASLIDGVLEAAGRHRSLVRRAHRREAARAGQGRRGGRHRPGADQGRPPAPARPAPRRTAGPRQPRQPQQGGLADGQGVPLRLRQRGERGGVGRPLREVEHPVTREAPVPGRGRQLLAPLGGGGRHPERHARAAPADLRPEGPHGSRRRHPVDAQAVPPLDRGHRAASVRGSGSLADHRQWLERDRPGRARPGSHEQGL